VQTTGFKVGIAIASSTTFLAILSLITFLIRRRSNRDYSAQNDQWYRGHDHDHEKYSVDVSDAAVVRSPFTSTSSNYTSSNYSNYSSMIATPAMATLDWALEARSPIGMLTAEFPQELPATEMRDSRSRILHDWVNLEVAGSNDHTRGRYL
jgi:hypothetical protein